MVALLQEQEPFNAGEVIMGHIANSSLEEPLIHLPKVFGIDFSVTKHVFMLWLVSAIIFIVLKLIMDVLNGVLDPRVRI